MHGSAAAMWATIAYNDLRVAEPTVLGAAFAPLLLSKCYDQARVGRRERLATEAANLLSYVAVLGSIQKTSEAALS